MPKEIMLERGPNLQNDARDFLKINWPVALAVAGGAGAMGAVVWLTARYLRGRRDRDELEDAALALAENEIAHNEDSTSSMLETGSFLGHIVGAEATVAASELANASDDAKMREMLDTLGRVVTMEIPRSGK